MGNLWFFILTALPSCMGAVMMGFAVFYRQRKVTHKLPHFSAITAITLFITVSGAAALLYIPEYHPEMTISWIPNTSVMHFHLGKSGLLAALATSAAAFLFVISDEYLSPLLGSVALIACSAANIAFVSGHFILRYVALEIVGLGIALIPLIEQKKQKGSDISRHVYMVLRLGDAGFLVAILLLAQYTGTLEISHALELGATLDSPPSVWITWGLMLAVWIKIGLWPFQNWLTAGFTLSPLGNGWFFQTLMPNLGLYLLYRIQPLLSASSQNQDFLRYSSLIVVFILLILAFRKIQRRESITIFLTVQGGLAAVWAASGVLHIIPIILYLTSLRVLLNLSYLSRMRRYSRVLTIAGGLSSVLFWGFSIIYDSPLFPRGIQLPVAIVVLVSAVWSIVFAQKHSHIVRETQLQKDGSSRFLPYHPSTRTAVSSGIAGWLKIGLNWGLQLIRRDTPDQVLRGVTLTVLDAGRWIRRVVEQNALEKLLRGITISILGIGKWLHRVVEQNTLENSLIKATTGILDFGRWLYRAVEHASLEGFLRWIRKAVQTMSVHLQKLHTGKLRYNLIWVLLCIITVVIILAY